MAKPSSLTAAQRQRIRELWAARVPTKEIAEEIGCSTSCVWHHAHALALIADRIRARLTDEELDGVCSQLGYIRQIR